MKRYHIAIEGLPTETVLAENGSDAFLKADFGSCRHGMEYKVKVYVAMDGEPDYPVNDSEFFADTERKPVVVAPFPMANDTLYGNALDAHLIGKNASPVTCVSCGKACFIRELYTKVHWPSALFRLHVGRAALARCRNSNPDGGNHMAGIMALAIITELTAGAAPSRAFYAILDCACR